MMVARKDNNSNETKLVDEKVHSEKPSIPAEGFYTVEDAATGDYYTYRIAVIRGGSLSGKTVISYLRGPDNGRDYTAFAFIRDGRLSPWKRFQSGYSDIVEFATYLVTGKVESSEARTLYAVKSGNCYVCRRRLTTPESIAAGIGPECAKKH